MTTTLAQGHRLFSRVPFMAQVTLQLPGQTLQVELLDIALKGALMRAEPGVTVTLNDSCRLVLPLNDGDEAIEMNGKVVHLEEGNIGMACADIDLQSLTRLRRLLELNTGDADMMDRELSHLFAKRGA
ncbi:MAG: PilZ domain-containing protein [Rhodoferax sp.]|nr:PilZ domain-containing protein [Betaproteobacteria bacterium]NCN96245.1 PilZ domain-containing protein [Rhodoferax sp.]OIP20883.1 MAG: hypothetical protein AUK50_02470 [Comamonadaceae bacterium CG2_30_57_122]PIZ23633.1 MAG: PilZ domain-containing protein [Comamonadaceae bacterium CG_4_10_14_0_8_um_filter_57_29]PJC14361.1 MAG: PilZ domain-containing protein [Comamonadaceae bacterium CG_4_9_14_0_8_um_filter_57_21]